VLLLLQEAVLAQWKAKQNVVEMPVLGMLAIVMMPVEGEVKISDK
jgi:hypothetical protein